MQERLANLIGALSLAVSDRMATATESAAGHGAKVPAALALVAVHPGCTIEQLRRHLHLTHSGGVRLVDRMAASGLVVRDAGAVGRAVALRLTPKGQEAADAVRGARQEVLASLVASLSVADQLAATAVLERLLGELRGRKRAPEICRLCDRDACPPADCPVLAGRTRG
jgi:DNA-binding MarR family transcriptional regulator